MAKDTYEISVWRDVLVNGHYEEAKIAVIGSDKLKASCRAIEPKLIENINGTNTFTFKMLYQCRDLEIQDLYTTLSVPLPALSTEQLLEESRNLLLVYHSLESTAAEGYANPFIPYLSNERKVKLLWKNQWYDLVIKNCQEDSSGRSIIYTCTDAYINELSKTGFDLVFSTEKQNNQGTVIELGERILEGSDWEIDAAASDIIQQENEEPVFEITLNDEIDVHDDTIDEDTSIYIGEKVLLYYQPIADLVASGQTNGSSKFQFAYATDYTVDDGTQLVNNAHCYTTSNSYSWSYNASSHRFTINGLYFDFNTDLSGRYRAKRLARQQKVVFDPVSKKQCKVYSAVVDGDEHEIYEYTDTVVNNPVTVGNIIANGSNFIDTSNWETSNAKLALYPELTSTTILTNYKPTSLFYTKVIDGSFTAYNSGLISCSNLLPDGLQAGARFVFRFRAMTDNDGKPSGIYLLSGSTINFNICHYTINSSGVKIPGASLISSSALVDEGNGWFHRIITISESATKADLLNNIGIFITSTASAWLEEIQFFKYVTKENTSTGSLAFVLPGELQTTSVVSARYNYYDHTIYGAGTALEDVKFIYQGTESTIPTGLSVVYNIGFTKVRSITGKQSNRFNLLQTIGEQFDCWVRFKVNHTSTGHLIYNADGTPQKYVYFKRTLGVKNNIGFVYGIDLKTIQRTVQSDNIVTKTIVNPNHNEFAQNGFCTIARAGNNFAKNTTIYNFDYYINQGLLDGEVITKDLYQKGSGAIGYYSYLHDYYTEYDANADIIMNLEINQNDLEMSKVLYASAMSSANELITSYKEKICKAAGLNDIGSLESAIAYLNSHKDNEDVSNLITGWAVTEKELSINSTLYNQSVLELDAINTRLNELYATQNGLLASIKALDLAFYKKYSRFIQEGSWQNDDYIDDNLYYLDAVALAYRSARPKVSYNIAVVRLSALEEFQNKVFRLGDITYIQDKEFFGMNSVNGIPTPVREQVIISEMTSNLDEPDKDSFIVQNYKSAFDDLFQRVTATTQSLQFSQGDYARAANAITGDGSIKPEVLQAAFNSNKELAMSATNDAVVQDANGITLSSLNDPSRRVRINSNGIFISKDGGNTWKNAVKSNGVATEALTAGAINANEISIFQGNAPTFRWDFNGISAYALNPDLNNTINTRTFVRYDRYGIYGIDGIGNDNWMPSSENDIWNTAQFGLTWKGFFLKNKTANGMVEISTKNDIQIIKSGEVRLKLGRLREDDITGSIYGLRINNAQGARALEADDEGNLWLSSFFAVGGSYATTASAKIGYDTSLVHVVDPDIPGAPAIISAGGTSSRPNFVVYSDGYVELRGGITWTAGSSPTQVLYARNNIAKPLDNTPWIDFPESSATDWHRVKNKNDIYGSYTYDGGVSWTFPILIQGRDGTSIEIKGNVSTWSELPTYGMGEGDGWIVDDASDDPDAPIGKPTDGILYIYLNSRWTYSGKIKGPAGPQGSTGPQGPAGPHGNDTEAITVYYTTNKSNTSEYDLVPIPSGVPQSTAGFNKWTTVDTDTTATYKYQYRSFGTKTIFYTNDGILDRIEYVYGPVELISIYGKNDAYAAQWQTYLKLTQNGSIQGILYDANTGDLYVNASFINSGTLLVGTSSQPLFEASINTTLPTVHIAGFTVTNNGTNGSLYYNTSTITSTSTRGIYVGTDGVLVTQGGTNPHYIKLDVDEGKIICNQLNATGGDIGGWVISNSKLYHPHGTGNDGVGMYYSGGKPRPSLWQKDGNNSPVNSPVVFYAGAKDDAPYPDNPSDCYFGVLADGSVYCQALKATNAVITGEINATSGMFSSGCTIGPSMSIGNWNTYYTALYSGEIISVNDITSLPSDNTQGSMLCVSADGTTAGCITFRSRLYTSVLNANSITLRETDGSYVALGVNNPGLRLYNKLDSDAATTRIELSRSYAYWDTDCDIYIAGKFGYTQSIYSSLIAYAPGATAPGGGKLQGTWYQNDGNAITSDQNLKHDIKDIEEKYSQFFDLLHPRTFLYNHGTSNRTHVGFIAQEIESISDVTDVSTYDTGIFVKHTYIKPMEDEGGQEIKQEVTECCIRYDEIIALNTWQIQKLKSRVASLEARIVELEARL